ncbi:MAG TPA: hypothetical protein VHH11_07480 [Gammaproteobacteria bacterium]|jgi:hypothetical protein|nr:hypothetical protein [Gammaproteobacteria bacterium]
MLAAHDIDYAIHGHETILPLDLDDHGRKLVCQKDVFLAAAKGGRSRGSRGASWRTAGRRAGEGSVLGALGNILRGR